MAPWSSARLSFAVLPALAFVAACGEPAGTTPGEAKVHQALDPVPWAFEAKLTSSQPHPYEGFGAAVAVSGDTAVVGSNPFKGFEETATVFRRSGLVWSREQVLREDPGTTIESLFGRAVAISGDTIAVGAFWDEDASGAAYVFVRSGSEWLRQQKLTPSDPRFGHCFGKVVALEGDTLAASGGSCGGADVHVFVRVGSTWTEQQRLVVSDRDYFGWDVAISGDTIVVTAYPKNAAYFFTRSGSTWTEQQKLTIEEPRKVALSGNTALFAQLDHATVVVREGSTWIARQTLIPSEPAPNIFHGYVVALDGDAALLGGSVSGTPTPSSAAYLFTRNGSTWSEAQRLSAPVPRPQDGFGLALALHGSTTLVGSPGADGGQGAAYVYTAPPSKAPTALSPSGAIDTEWPNNWPTYRFTRVDHATHYELSVANVLTRTFSAAEAGCATAVETCAVTPSNALPTGSTTWRVRALGAGGDATPWSNELSVSISRTATPPGIVSDAIAPRGTTFSTTPTYQWNAVPMATRYTLWVNDWTASGSAPRTVLEVYEAEELGCAAGGVCTATPAKALAYGPAKWWVLAQNPLGSAAWSPAIEFVVAHPPPSLAPVPIAPIGQIAGGSAISYSFESVPLATEYHLWINDSSGTLFERKYSAESAGCANGGTCTVTPTEPAGIGLRTWWVRAQNSSGYSAWSAAVSFTIGGGSPPGVPTLLSPSGSTTSATPTYTWSAVTDATKYLLWVNDSQGLRLLRYYTAEAAECSDGTCAVAPEVAVALGAAIWWLQAANDAGPGAWVSQPFTVEPL